jgi:DNA-binding beta-propeller fold protein YncE
MEGSLRMCAAAFAMLMAAFTPANAEPFMIIGLDAKMTWDERGQPVLSKPGRDAVVVTDLAQPEVPRIVAVLPLENSVAGPPVNVAISHDNSIAIVANSVSNVPQPGGGFRQVPAQQLFVVDLGAAPPKLVQTVSVGAQPSGLSIGPRGDLMLVAYRAESTVGVFRIEQKRLREVGRVDVEESSSHVAFTPDGRRALAVKQAANKVSVLEIDGENVTRVLDLPTGNGPYNVATTPDGRLGVTSGRGFLTVIDLQADPPCLIDTVKVAAGSEGFAISPRGDIAVSVALLGSNGDRSAPTYHEKGAIVVLRIDGDRLKPIRQIEVGRVPEGVGFTPDGRHLYVANYYDNDVWIFRVDGTEITDTGRRLVLPGRPASLRVTPAHR